MSVGDCIGLIRPHFDPTRSLGQAFLTPTLIYVVPCLAAIRETQTVKALAHITGGGLAANLARVLPPGTGAVVERASWRPPPVFGLLADRYSDLAGADGEESDEDDE